MKTQHNKPSALITIECTRKFIKYLILPKIHGKARNGQEIDTQYALVQTKIYVSLFSKISSLDKYICNTSLNNINKSVFNRIHCYITCYVMIVPEFQM